MTPDELDEQLLQQGRIAVTKKMLEDIVAAMTYTICWPPETWTKTWNCGEFRLLVTPTNLGAL